MTSSEKVSFALIEAADAPELRTHRPYGRWAEALQAAVDQPTSAVFIEGLLDLDRRTLHAVVRNKNGAWHDRVQLVQRKQPDGHYSVWITAKT